MTNRTNNPAEVDAMLRAAGKRGAITPPTEAEAQEPPTPRPLPGGGATPHYAPVVPSGDALLRGAISAAKGEGIPHHLRPFISLTGTSTVVTGVS